MSCNELPMANQVPTTIIPRTRQHEKRSRSLYTVTIHAAESLHQATHHEEHARKELTLARQAWAEPLPFLYCILRTQSLPARPGSPAHSYRRDGSGCECPPLSRKCMAKESAASLGSAPNRGIS